jgi:hypothetical protein
VATVSGEYPRYYEDKVLRQGCETCGHQRGDHDTWWDDDNGQSGMACSLLTCDCDDLR